LRAAVVGDSRGSQAKRRIRAAGAPTMRRKTFYLFTGPSIFLMLTLMVFPLIMAVWLGFNYMTFRNINAPVFIGLSNYIDVFTDPLFWQALRFTLLLIAITVPVQMFLGFVMALLLDQISVRVRGIYLALMLLPFIVVPIVGTLMFKQLFEPSGLIAWIYQRVTGEQFFYTELSVKALIVIHSIWYITPFPLVVFFAGLQTLPQDLVEASAIDGATRLQQIRHIVLTHLEPLIVLVGLISIMDAYRIFDSVFVLTVLNPIYHANTLMLYNYQVAMRVQRLDKASAMAVLTVIGIMVVLIPWLVRTYRTQVEER
jgi:ABC-type sugar transport system permease subunit